MPNDNVLTKHPEMGAQLVTVDISSMVKIEEADIEKYASEGYYMFELAGSSGSIYYRLPEPDGLVRDVDAYIETNGFDRRMKLNNKERDQLVWASNVERYFEEIIKDDVFVEQVETLCKKELNTPSKNGDKPFQLDTEFEEAKEYLKGLESKKGGTGKRPMSVYDFLTKKRTGWFDRSRRAYEKYNGVMVNHKTSPTWVNKKFWR